MIYSLWQEGKRSPPYRASGKGPDASQLATGIGRFLGFATDKSEIEAGPLYARHAFGDLLR